jgi:hypothetical protein
MLIFTVTAVLLVSANAAAQTTAHGERDLSRVLARIGEQVRDFYARIEPIVCTEEVTEQPLGIDLQERGAARRLTYELRIAPPEDRTADGFTGLRALVAVNGRPVRGERSPACGDPRAFHTEPLGFLLPERQPAFVFTWGEAPRPGAGTLQIDFVPIGAGRAVIEWEGSCFTLVAPDRRAGRIWVDAHTFDVLRLDERLSEPVVPLEPAAMRRGVRLERLERSIRYGPVRFGNPDDTIVLPVAAEQLTILHGARLPRTRTTHVFGEYRRFLTDVRIR